MSLRVLIAVTHLLGIGHLTRAAAIGNALARAGHQVTLVSGGMPAPLATAPGLRLVQLEPVQVRSTAFRVLLDREGCPVETGHRDARRRGLLSALRSAQPHVIITELFPLGRRSLASEFMALIEAAGERRPPPLILSSIRDILVAPGQPDRIAEAHERLSRHYDGVLVHGDPGLVPLEASWPLDEALRAMLHYTGYVCDDRPVAAGAEARSGIVVSGGGSAASLPLYRTAARAAALVPGHDWRILVGAGIPDDDVAALRRLAPGHAAVERTRPDFPALLGRAALSISQAGYNTAVDVLRAGTPAILVPFEGGRETEQRLRAERLAGRGLAVVLPEEGLLPQALADAARRALAEPRPRAAPVALDGADRSVAIVEGLARRRGAAVAAPVVVPPPLPWAPLDDALGRLADSGRTLAVWWRDDDVVACTAALERLLALSRDRRVPIALAAVPARIHSALPSRLADEPLVDVLVHGLSHANHAPAGRKKAEFGPDRPIAVREAEAAQALRLCGAAFPGKALPVLVPPWNRIDAELTAALPGLGYRGLSAFRGRTGSLPTDGLLQVDCHVDPIDWHGTRSLADPARLIADLARMIECRLAAPGRGADGIGLLTHHLVHDEAVWSFCAALLERVAACRHIRHPSFREFLSAEARCPGIESRHLQSSPLMS